MLMPKATGDWETDKKTFIRLQKEMEDLANIIDLNED